MGTVLTNDAIVATARALRAAGKSVVTYNGSFDLLHAGHLRTLESAKAQGDALFVLVNSDVSVRRYKGPGRPIVSEAERAALLAALAYVDYVTVFDDLIPNALLAQVAPDIHCVGTDWGEGCIERAVVEAHGGRIQILPWLPGQSTSALLARSAAAATSPVRAVFLDRDGTLNVDTGYVHRRTDWQFCPGAVGALAALSRTDFRIIIVTNQSGIGRGFYPASAMEDLHRWIFAELAVHGVRIDAIYHCPHAPDDGCGCRKPKPGLLERAADGFGIALARSWVVGDSPRDVEAGRRVNARTIKLGDRMPPEAKLEPTAYAHDLAGAVAYILAAEAAEVHETASAEARVTT